MNADASAWGGELLAGGFGFATALHTGFSDANGGGAPNPNPKPNPNPNPNPKPKPNPNPNSKPI